MAASSLVVIAELRLYKHPLLLNLTSNGCNETVDGLLLLSRESGGRLGVVYGSLWISRVREDLIHISSERRVVNEARWEAVLVEERGHLCITEVEVESAEASLESSLADPALSELVEVKEELLDADTVSGDHGLETLLNVCLDVQEGDALLLGGWVIGFSNLDGLS